MQNTADRRYGRTANDVAELMLFLGPDGARRTTGPPIWIDRGTGQTAFTRVL